MTPSFGYVGTRVTLSISSPYSLGGYYQILWSPSAAFDSDNTVIVRAGHVPDGSSSVVAGFAVPEATYGVNHVRFVGLDSGERIGFLFSVKPSVKVTPSSVKAGSTIKVVGTGFPGEDIVALTLGDNIARLSVKTNKVGSFSCSVIIPEAPSGLHNLVVTALHIYTEPVTVTIEVLPTENPIEPDVGNTRDIATEPDSNNSSYRTTFEDKMPPLPPVPVSPMGHSFGLVGTKSVVFTWTGVSDPSNVTYDLEVANDVDFTMIKSGLQKIGLTETNCTIDIPPGIYYWRVRAVDGAGNASYWSPAPHAFRVAEISSLINDILRFLGLL